jgi:hypothetical protein
LISTNKIDPKTKLPNGEIEHLYHPTPQAPREQLRVVGKWLTCSFQVDSIIAGLLSYPPNLLLLAYTTSTPPPTPSSSQQDFRRPAATRPELRIISPTQDELSSDALSLKDYGRLSPGDYSLHWNARGKCVYVVSPSEVVVGRERSAEDRVEWLLERGRYGDALGVFESVGGGGDVGRWNRKEIGVKYIEHLIEEGTNAVSPINKSL